MADETYSKTIKYLMIKKGLKNKDLADSLKVSESLVSQWLSGWKTPQLPELIKMSKFFNVPIDTIVTGRSIKTLTEEFEIAKAKAIQYDFYKYVNKEYDLKENPELIIEHFEYLIANPEKCNEIPKKYGKWNIVKIIHELKYKGNQYEIYLQQKEINGTNYTFSMRFSGMSHVQERGKWLLKLNKYEIGEVSVVIDFDKSVPQYCGHVNFNFTKDISKSDPKNKDNGMCEIIEIIVHLISQVFTQNNIDDTFLIASDKNAPMTIRECIKRKIHFFVIPKTDNNKLYWDNEIGEVNQRKNRVEDDELRDLEIKIKKEKLHSERLQYAMNKSIVLYGHPNNAYKLMTNDDE